MFHRSLLIATLALATFALGSAIPGSDDVEAGGPPAGWSLPAQAREVAPNVWFLGTAIVDGAVAQGYAFVHPRQNAGKPPWAGGPGGNGDDPADDPEATDGDSSCYALIAKGAKWKQVEPWVVSTVGSPVAGTEGILTAAILEWEGAAGADILGAGQAVNHPLVADETSPDGINEVLFGAIADPNTIAVTITWGYFGGRPSARELIEWDMVFNTSYAWATNGSATAMDYENIAQHELGHAIGLTHPGLTCTAETMHRYASLGETLKRSLALGDIAGVRKLY